MAFLAPWIFLLFIGILDTGFYTYAAISTANAARVAAMYTSSTAAAGLDSSADACNAAIEEMRSLPNIKTFVNCSAGCTAGATCSAGSNLDVTATRILAASSPDTSADATQVQVRYTTVQMFPFPGFKGQYTITRTVKMRRRY
jgi:hypothetical protein